MSNHLEYFPTTKNTEEVGSVTIKNDELFIGREEQEINAYIKSKDREDIKVGDYLRIPYTTSEESEKQRLLFGVITRLQYRQKTTFDDQYDSNVSRDIGEHNYAYIARIEPIAIVEDEGERKETEDEEELLLEDKVVYKRKSVSIPPKPQADVFIADDKKILQVGLDIPESGDFAGFLAVAGEKVPDENDTLGYFFENPGHTKEKEPQIFRHTIVAGSTGKGKTHFSKNILRQYVDNKRFKEEIPDEERKENNMEDTTRGRLLNLSIIDPENEYIDMKNDGEKLTEEQKELCQKYGIQYGGIKNDPDLSIEAWKPAVGDTMGQAKAGKEFHIPFRLVNKFPDLLFHSSTKDTTKNTIKNMVSRFFSEFPNKDEQTYEKFSEWGQRHLEQSTDIHDSIKKAIQSRILYEGLFLDVFDSGGRALDECSQEMFERGQVTVFPMNHLGGEKERFVVLTLMVYIVHNKLTSNPLDTHINGTPMLLSIDEGHRYLSEPTTQRERLLINKFRETARRGRKVNLGLYVVTQNPEDIDGEIRKQINTKIFLGLDPNVVESQEVHVPQSFKSRVKEFDKGGAVIQAPGKRPVEVKGLPFCVVAHKE